MEDNPARAIEIIKNGKAFKGSFTIEGDVMTVAYLATTKKAELGTTRQEPETVAAEMLRQMVAEAERET